MENFYSTYLIKCQKIRSYEKLKNKIKMRNMPSDSIKHVLKRTYYLNIYIYI